MKKITSLLAALMLLVSGVTFAQNQNAAPAAAKAHQKNEVKKDAKAVDASKPATHLKKDGTPDKRYKANQKLKKDGTPDKRFKENKAASPAPAK